MVLAEIIHRGLNKDWLSCFGLFCNKVCLIRDTIGCTLLEAITAIAVNEKKSKPAGASRRWMTTLYL